MGGNLFEDDELSDPISNVDEADVEACNSNWVLFSRFLCRMALII